MFYTSTVLKLTRWRSFFGQFFWRSMQVNFSRNSIDINVFCDTDVSNSVHLKKILATDRGNFNFPSIRSEILTKQNWYNDGSKLLPMIFKWGKNFLGAQRESAIKTIRPNQCQETSSSVLVQVYNWPISPKGNMNKIAAMKQEPLVN